MFFSVFHGEITQERGRGEQNMGQADLHEKQPSNKHSFS
jgi:hypothetical protein